MHILQGIPVSPGIAIGDALVIGDEGLRIPRRFIARAFVERELERYHAALDGVSAQIEESRQAVSRELGEKYAAIFSAQREMLHDPQLQTEVEKLISKKFFSPEYAVSRALRRYVDVFQSLSQPHMAERANDVLDIERRLLRTLLGSRSEDQANLDTPAVVLAHNLTPSETANLDREKVLGFVTESGGPGGHTAIVAKALEIPAVVGTGRFLKDAAIGVSSGETMIVDGDSGKVIFQPDKETIARYEQELKKNQEFLRGLQELRELPAETVDGTKITLCANIEFPHEVEPCLSRGADGIGLYRTEFLYLGAETEPSEEDHFAAYCEVLSAMGDRPVVIRTLDLGADKLGLNPELEIESNPFLGLRSIRLSLRNLPLFRTQLRAVLRASPRGNARLMFPMVTTVGELRQAKAVLAEIETELREEGVEFDEGIPLGIMIEVPAAVLAIDKFIPEISFVSIGTNDLVQYTLAVDRGNKEVAPLYNASEPAVLRLIEHTLRECGAAGVEVAMCGQMCASPPHALLLLGMGLRHLSVPPSAVPEIKKLCRSVDIARCETMAGKVAQMESAAQIDAYLNQELHLIVPELAVIAAT